MKLKVVRVYVHGACRGNPGLSAIGILVCTVTDKVLKEHSEAIGEHTNHEAEYLALIRSLEVASEYTKSKAQVFLNNLVEARQSTGEYKVKQARLLPLRDKVVRLAEEFEDVDLCIVPRDYRMLVSANALANRALDCVHQGAEGGDK